MRYSPPDNPCTGGIPVDPAGDPAAAAQRTVVESPGFYRDSDGLYYWDGNPPKGDMGPVVITDAWTMAFAPANGEGGLVKSHFILSGGDQHKTQLTVDASYQGIKLIHASELGTDWEMCSLGFFACKSYPVRYMAELELEAYQCGVVVTVGGTAYGRKSWPFGFQPEIDVKIGSIQFLQNWGTKPKLLRAHTDAGLSCTATPTLPSGGGGSTPPSSYPYSYWPSVPTELPHVTCDIVTYYHWDFYEYPSGVPDGDIPLVASWTFDSEERICYAT